MNVVQQLLDWCLPPHSDVVRARRVSERALARACVFRRSPAGVYTALSYRNPDVQALIRANKFYGDRQAATRLASVLHNLIAHVMDTNVNESLRAETLLVPMPSSKKKRRERGYNQVERIIERLPDDMHARFNDAPHVLARHDRTSQARVTRTARAENIRGAFFVPHQHEVILRSRAVFLVDDVSESGATMADAARALNEAGAGMVIGIALAK